MGGNSVVNPMGHNFLGTGGTPLNKPLNSVTLLNPGFLGGGMTGRVGRDLATMGLGEFTQSNPFGIPGNPLASVFGNGPQNSGAPVPGPFSLDAVQLANDQGLIRDLGNSQNTQNQDFIREDAATRSSSRDALAAALTKQAQQSFSQTLPQTAEDYNAGHLLNSSGYGNEVARQQANLAAQISNQVGLQGVSDINRSSDQRATALQGLQGFGQAGLGRQLGLEDFINQANVAKTIGAQTAPQVGNGKGQTGTLLGGVGALAPLVSAAKGFGKAGPAGAAAGALA